MRRGVLALGLSAVVGCGGDSGILVSVTQDETVIEPVEALHFVIGVYDAESDSYVRDDFGAETLADVTGRDLVADPYRLLLRDAGDAQPTSIVVGVIGETGGLPVAFAGMSAPMTFQGGSVMEIQLVLTDGTDDFSSTATGCISWGEVTIVSPTDLDCDGCDDATGSGCGDECEAPADCDAAFGAPPCGAWECNAGSCDVVCPDCIDADLDGYGQGTGCAGPDCDDADDQVVDGSTVSCYSGDLATLDVGVCRAGVRTCRGGIFTPCSGEVIPGGEGCNLEDDDCDTEVDEDLGVIGCGTGACANSAPACVGGTPGACTPLPVVAINDAICDGIDDDCDGSIDEDCNCVLVANGGNDATAIGNNNTTPFATIQAAIDWAAADNTRPRVVCLATNCGGVPMSYTGPVTMRGGIHVQGGYSLARARCGTTSIIATGTATGVLFDDLVQEPTTLDGVNVNRFAGGDAATVAGVTVDAASQVTLSGLEITNAPAVANSYGVDLINGGQALITRSRIHGGNGAVETIGVRSVGSTPTIRDNCSGYDLAGRCNWWCDEQWIMGREASGSGTVHAVWLKDSAGAVVEQNSLCSVNGAVGSVVRITGKAIGVIVRRNWIDAWGPTGESSGVYAEDCDGDAPWITDNAGIWAAGDLPTTAVAGVRALGDCHPVVDSNVAIYGGGEGGAAGTTGVFCGRSTTSAVASRCVVNDNRTIQSSQFGVPPESVGVRCEDGGCMRIVRNGINAHGGVRTYGVWLGRTGALVENNDINGGCGATESIGVRAIVSSARLENNRIFAGTCANGTSGGGVYIGLHALLEAGPSELYVHSNHIDGDGDVVSACRSVGIRLSAGPAVPAAGSGRYKNNIIRAGRCVVAYGIEETGANTDPFELWNNDLAPNDSPTGLYRDEGTTDLTDIANVNNLSDVDARSNISVDPMQPGYPGDVHLNNASMCIGAGTPAGAPPVDMDGDPRDPTAPDIGPDEAG